MLRILLRRRKRPLSTEDVTITDRPAVHKAVSAAALGTTMEWFDFGVYAYLAGTLGKVFFPSSSPGAQVVSTFATLPRRFSSGPWAAWYSARSATVSAVSGCSPPS